MAMTRKGWSISALSTELEVDRRTVAKRLSEAGVRPIGERAGAPVYDLRDAVEAVLRTYQSRAKAGDHASDTRGIFLQQKIPTAAIIPWSHSEVVTFPEYEEHAGLDEGETVSLLVYGFPFYPPAEGEKHGRVSIPHADRWRWLFGLLVTARGGDGDSLRLIDEVNRLCR